MLKDKVVPIEMQSPSFTWGPVIDLPEIQNPVPKLDREILPEALQGLVFDTAYRQQSPVEFTAVSAICALASVLGSKALICPKANDTDWQITPNQWGMIIGRPSAMKSPAMKSALKPLQDLESEHRREHELEKGELEAEKIVQKAKQDDVMKQIKAAARSGDDSTARELAKSLTQADDSTIRRRFKVNDSTVEKLGELLNENPNGLLLVRDELTGWLSKLQKEEYQSDRSFYLEAWEGRNQFTYDRIGRGTIDIENCTISVIGGVQPSKLAPLIKGAKTGQSDDGLVQRFQLAVMPDDIHSWKWIDASPDHDAYVRYEEVFTKLDQLPFDHENPLSLKFDDASQLMFINWMTELQTKARSSNAHPAFESHLLKMPKCIAGLALLFELIDFDGDTPACVGELATARALEWADLLEAHANRIYELGRTNETDAAKTIINRRAKLSEKFSARELTRKHWVGLDTSDAVAGTLELLIDHSFLRELRIETGGRPCIEYIWNPALSQENT